MEFFTLIEKLKNLGIAAKLCSASNPTELCEEWNKFLSENSELVEEIKAWGQEFAEDENSEAIFKESAVVEDSKEVAIIICVCDDTMNVSECEIFEDCADFENSLIATGEKVAIAVAGISSSGNMISDTTAEAIFDYIQKNLTDENTDTDADDGEAESGDGEEEAECGEESDADEVESDKTEADAAETADADTNYDAE